MEHPVVDADGHIVEALPVVVEHIRRVAGDRAADGLIPSSVTYATDGAQPKQGSVMAPWWTLPADARERATSFCPALLHERLDEIGIDFAILYSSVGLLAFAHADDEVRRGACRGLNHYLAESVDGLGDRLAVAAVIPTHTPDEAVAELTYAVRELGFKAVMLNDIVTRDGWYDLLAVDSAYDYDPVWQTCVDLGVAVTAHSPSWGVGLRQSSSRYMFNHIGNFAASADAFAKALFFGGVLDRFPSLHVAFLECGVSWAVQLHGDLVDRWQKRGPQAIGRLDPAHLDEVRWNDLLDRYGRGMFDEASVRAVMAKQSGQPPASTDDFRDAGITSAGDITGQFARLFFGCEADDPSVPLAFGEPALQPVLGSDIGHWDVVDPAQVVPEAKEHLSDDQFRAFACDNVIRLHGAMNPTFFDGTRVATYARSLLDSEIASS